MMMWTKVVALGLSSLVDFNEAGTPATSSEVARTSEDSALDGECGGTIARRKSPSRHPGTATMHVIHATNGLNGLCMQMVVVGCIALWWYRKQYADVSKCSFVFSFLVKSPECVKVLLLPPPVSPRCTELPERLSSLPSFATSVSIPAVGSICTVLALVDQTVLGESVA